MPASTSLRLLIAAVLALALSGCRGCQDKSAQIDPSLSVAPVSVSYGKVKVGQSLTLPVRLTSESRASVTISGLRVVDLEPAGAAAAFTILSPPEGVTALQSETVQVQFTPTALQLYAAQLVIASDDPDRPEIKVTLAGEGSTGNLVATPMCDPASNCKGAATLMPPSLDFGDEPISRASPLPVTELPQVALVNEGEVEVAITHLAIEGDDADAFTMQGNTELEGSLPDGTPALLLGGGEGRSIAIRFVPTSAMQDVYAAELVIRSDDLVNPEIRIPLSGRRAENLPPVVCANVITVTNGDGSPPASYDTAEHWAPLIPAPMGMPYDFSNTRDVQPSSRSSQSQPGRGPTTVRFSANSNPTDTSTCTYDPEDARAGLTYLWEVIEQPAGGVPTQFSPSAAISANPTLQLSQATGTYRVRLTVEDALQATTQVELVFVAVLKEDLVVQLSWNGDNRAYDRVDLDLHVVRPSSTDGGTFSGAFSFFEEAPTGKTSGDINGVSRFTLQPQIVGANFEWGDAGVADDPRMNLDDNGTGELLENISLNYPERDPRCETDACDYKVLVHYFDDARNHASPATCTVGGACSDGEQCDCASGLRCVANDGATRTGPGSCYVAPEFTIRVFVRGDPTPIREIPVTADGLSIGAVCQMMYVADVRWPSRTEIAANQAADGGFPLPEVVVQGDDGAGNITPVLASFGQRMGLKCQPNTTVNATPWYDPQ